MSIKKMIRKVTSSLNLLNITQKTNRRTDFIWKAVESYYTAFGFLTRLPLDFDIKQKRLKCVRSILPLLPWIFITYVIIGISITITKMVHIAYIFVLPTTLTGMTPEQYKEFSTLINILSMPYVIGLFGSCPLIGLFIFFYGKDATAVINTMLEMEESLEKSTLIINHMA